MQVQECRAVVQGWAAVWSPALLLGKVHGAVKAEEFIARGTGKRGAIILSFGSHKEKKEAEARLVKEDGIIMALDYTQLIVLGQLVIRITESGHIGQLDISEKVDET